MAACLHLYCAAWALLLMLLERYPSWGWRVWRCQKGKDQLSSEHGLQVLKHFLLVGSPGPGVWLFDEIQEGVSDVRERGDEFPVEVAEYKEQLYGLDVCQRRLFLDGFKFDWIHLYSPLSYYHPKVLHFFGWECTLFQFKVHFLFSEVLKNLPSLFIMCYLIQGVDQQVVHVNYQLALYNIISKEIIHEDLGCGWWVAYSKEHDVWFE